MLTVRFHAAVHQLLTDEGRVRFGFVPAPAATYGLDPALGDLDLYVARDGRSDIPVVVPSTSELRVPAGPTVVDGLLWTYPAEVAPPSGEQQHLTQAIVVATGFGAPGPIPKFIHVEGTLGPPTLSRAHLLRVDDLPAPVLFQPTATPPKIGSRVAVRGRLGLYQVIRGGAGFAVLSLRGTATATASRRSQAAQGPRPAVREPAAATVTPLEAPPAVGLSPDETLEGPEIAEDPREPEEGTLGDLSGAAGDEGLVELDTEEARG